LAEQEIRQRKARNRGRKIAVRFVPTLPSLMMVMKFRPENNFLLLLIDRQREREREREGGKGIKHIWRQKNREREEGIETRLL